MISKSQPSYLDSMDRANILSYSSSMHEVYTKAVSTYLIKS